MAKSNNNKNKKSYNFNLSNRKSNYNFKLAKDGESTLRTRLTTMDGEYVGDVSLKFIEALQNNTLDTYKPYDYEKKAYDKYKSTPQFTLDTGDYSAYPNGKFGYGNIDLTQRPVYKNADGSISTVDSISINEDGVEILIPTIVKDGQGKAKRLTENEAIEHYHKTGEYLGKFSTPDEATTYAQHLHNSQDKFYNQSKVSYDALKSIENGTLDAYIKTSTNADEKKVLENYRSAKIIPIKDDAKRVVSYVSYDEYNAMRNGKLDDYIKTNADTNDKVRLDIVRKQPTLPLVIQKDGKPVNLGNVSYDDMMKMQNGDFESGWDAATSSIAIENYLKQPIFSLTMEIDGKEKNFGNVSYEVAKAVYSGKVSIEDIEKTDLYERSTKEEQKALKAMSEYVDKLDDPRNFWDYLSTVPYTLGKIGAGAIGGVEKAGDWLLGGMTWLGSKATDIVVPDRMGNAASDKLKQQSEFWINKETVGDKWSESIESRYRVPDWIRNNIGTTATSFGEMLPALAVEIMSGSAVPTKLDTLPYEMYKLWQGGSKSAKALNTAKQMVTRLTTFKPSDIVFGSSAAKSYAQSGLEMSGDIDKAMAYGALGGLGEVMTEKLDGGYAGTGIGADTVDSLIDFSKSKYFKKLANTKIEKFLNGKIAKKTGDMLGEMYEEALMAEADPIFQKLTVNPNAKLADMKDLTEGAWQGLLLSIFSNAAMLPINKYQKKKTINILNEASDKINAMTKDDVVKLEPLSYKATDDEIKARQEQIKTFEDAYVIKSTVDFVVSNPEVVAEVRKQSQQAETIDNTTTGTSGISVGTMLKNTKTGNTVKVISSDATNTVLEVTDSNGNIGQRIIETETLNKGMTNGQIVVVGDESTPSETAIAENATTTTETTPTNNTETKTISLTRMGDFYEVYGDNAIALAENLDMETTRKVVNGVETDVLAIPANIADDWANAMAEDGYTINFSDKPTITPKNESVVNETETTDETTPSEEKVETVEKMEAVIGAIEETLTDKAKEDLQNGQVKENYARITESIIKRYKAEGSLKAFAPFFTDGGKKVESAIKDLLSVADTSSESSKDNSLDNDLDNVKTVSEDTKVLKNEPESDMMESTTENTSAEREDNDDARGSNSLSRDGRRRHNGSSRKQVGRISYFEQRNQGKDATERQAFARELIERGQTEEVTVGKYRYTIIKPEAYNDDMKSMAEEAKKKGVEIQFVVGKVRVNYDTKDEFTIRGLKLSSSKVVVQYDNDKSPQKIAKHEIIHAKWNTEVIQAIRTKILKSLSLQDTKDIFAQERYARYKRIYKDDNLVLEEFICDVMSGANEYYERFADTVNDYWYGDESVDSYNVAEYSESIDAGGEDAAESNYDLSDEGGEHDEKRNNSRRISGIFEKSGDKRGGDSGNKQKVFDSSNESKVLSRRRGESDKNETVGSREGLMVHSVENSVRKNDHRNDENSNGRIGRKNTPTWQETNNRRFQDALDNNDDATAREMLDNQAEMHEYVPLTLFHGTDAEDVFTVFDKEFPIWVTKNYDYAHKYAYVDEVTNSKKSSQLHTESGSNIYPLYGKLGRVLELGDIEQELKSYDDYEKFSEHIGFSLDEVISCIDNKNSLRSLYILEITNTSKFAELARKKGYDSLHALEYGGEVETYGILHPENVKSAKLKTYDDKGNLIPLSERFDNTNDDIRYDLSDEDSDGNTLTAEQQEYFKNSKVRDENGNLLVVYHGTRNKDFTVFKRNHNYYTDNRNMAESYAPNSAIYEGYLNITNPYIIDAGGSKWSAIPVSAEVKKMLDEAGSSTFKEKGKWCTSVADIVAAISDMVDEGEADYDGVIIRNVDDTGSYYKGSNKNIGNDYITFKSEQFKNTDNTNPTTDPDIRYDISEEQDAEYMKSVEIGDMETVAKMIEDAAEKSFPNSKVRGNDGKLKLVYHGRVSDFNVFDRSFANIEGDFGKGYYFTSNEYDVDANYANEDGPDLKNKIARYAEQLEWNDEYSDLSYEEREEIARQKIITSEPNTITAYLNMENPVYITPDEKGTLLDYTEEYDEEYDEYGEPEGLLIDFVEALNNIASDYAYNDVDFNFLYEYAYDNGGVYASDAVGVIKRRMVYELIDEEGNIATNEVIRLAFEEIGFDGIIDTSVYYKFRNMDGMDSGTTHYIVFDSEQIKSAEPVTYDDDGNVIPLSKRFNKDNNDIRYDLDDKGDTLKTQKRIEGIAKEIGSHEEFIELTKQNTQEFVDKIKENKSLQKRLKNAKRQMLVNPNPVVNVTMAGKVTKDILTEMESTLKAKDLQDEVISIYTEHAQAIKKSGGVESKVQEANDTMVKRFSALAVDIADSAETFVESEMYTLLKSYVKETRIKIPDYAKEEAHFAEFRKSHMGTFNLTNDGLDIDMAYQELCEMFPGMFNAEVSSPADQLNAIADQLDALKPYAYNPHSGYMNEAIDHIVNRFVSEADGITAAPKTKAQKMAEKSKADKEEALYKEKESWARKMDREKAKSEKNIQALQKKINDAKYVQYWEKRLSKEEKQEAVQKVRDAQKKAVLKSKIRNIVADMKKHLDKTEKNGGYPKELVKAAADVCSVIDFRTDRTNKDGTPTKTTLKLDALRNQYDALKDSPNYDFQTEYSEEISERIRVLNQNVGNKRVIDLTLDELSRLKDILSEIHHGLSIASQQIGKDNAKANYEIFTEIVNDLEQIDVTNWEHTILKGESWVINPNRIFEMIANYNKDSAFWKLYEGILQGERGRKKFTMDANMPFDELTDGGANEVAFYDFRTKEYKTGIKYVDGTEVEIPKSIICELVMLWERKDGKKHLASGGMKIPNMKRFNKGKTRDAMDRGKLTRPITQADITRLRGMLDSYDKAWINRAYHLFNKVGKDAINKTSMQLLGREIAKAKNYIRAYVDSDFVRQEIDKKNDNITLEGHGSLKETDPNAQNPVVLRGLHENVYDHIDFVAKYSNLAIPIRNFNKVYKLSDVGDNGHRSIKSMLGKKFGSAIRDDVIVKTINELQYPRPKKISVFQKVRGNWLNATFFANVKSMFKQTTSYWTASSILDESSLLAGLKNYVGHSKQTKDEIAKYSGTLYGRSQGLSTTELGDRANRKRLAGASSNVTKAVNKYAPWLRNVPEGVRPDNWLQSMDVNTSAALWEACKVEVSKTMDKSDEKYMQTVTDLWERVIEETQSNYDLLHRPEILKSEGLKTLSMFQNDNLQQTGILKSAYSNLRVKQKAYESNSSEANKKALDEAIKRMGKAVRARIYSSLWMAMVSVLGDALLRKFKPYIDDEEKEITASSVLEQMRLTMCEDMLGVFVPIAGDLLKRAKDTVMNGYDFMNEPSLDVIDGFLKTSANIAKEFYKEDGDVWKAISGGLRDISNMTGIPVKNVYDLYKSVKGYIGDIKVGKFAHDLEEYTSGNKSFYSYGDLASYIVSGNTAKETKWNDYYSANGKEISKGSLTTEIKPAYVQMYVDSPEKASELKRKLVLEYDYSGDSIDKWMVDEYLKHIVSDPEYAVEIKNAVQQNANISYESVYKTIRSYYKGVYKDGDEAEIKALRNALLKDAWITKDYISQWELEADAETEKARLKQEAEKEKYR